MAEEKVLSEQEAKNKKINCEVRDILSRIEEKEVRHRLEMKKLKLDLEIARIGCECRHLEDGACSVCKAAIQ